MIFLKIQTQANAEDIHCNIDYKNTNLEATYIPNI